MMHASASARVVLVSAIASGQGKTTVTAALARRLLKQGQRVRVFKTGPDFLDPMILQRAGGAPVGMLDLWIVGLEECRRLLARAASEADVILIEGVMGLYDGAPSSADLARAFEVPVMAVLNASAMAQTAGALVMGLRDYGPVNLAGAVANRIGSAAHASMVREAMRGTPLLATLPHQVKSLPERHLGLVQASEVEALEELLDQLADQLALDDDAWNALPLTQFDAVVPAPLPERALSGRTIAVARDAAFAFLYEANLECLQSLGAVLRFFSPLNDEQVPSGADAVYLPGGYPELHAERLSRAAQWRKSIAAFHAAGRPIVAECGGMMALAASLGDSSGQSWPMAGLLAGHVSMQSRLAGLGPQGWATPWGELRGHTFHYSRFDTPLNPVAWTAKHPSQQAGEAIFREGRVTASYFHAYFPSCPAAVARLFLGESA